MGSNYDSFRRRSIPVITFKLCIPVWKRFLTIRLGSQVAHLPARRERGNSPSGCATRKTGKSSSFRRIRSKGEFRFSFGPQEGKTRKKSGANRAGFIFNRDVAQLRVFAAQERPSRITAALIATRHPPTPPVPPVPSREKSSLGNKTENAA